MTVSRGIAVLAIAVVAVVAWLLLAGGSTHHYTLVFQNAGQLVKGNDVQIGGRRVGNVDDIKLGKNNLAEVKVSIEEPYAPLHAGSTAQIRSGSLSGVANRFVSINPGPNSSQKIDDDQTLGLDTTTSAVDLDQLFNTLDPKARKSLQQVIDGSATQYKGKGAKANEALKYFNPALSTTSRLVNELDRDQQSLQDFIIYTARATTALASRRNDLSSLVSNANQTTGAIGSESASLNRALLALPTTLRQANTTFVNLRSTLDDLDQLVNASKPVAPRLAPFFRQLRPLVTEARPTIKDLRTLIDRPGAGNDLIDLLQKQPRLTQVATPAFQHTVQGLRQGTPVLQFIRPYAPDLIGWFRDFGQSTANYDANGHFARISPIVNAFQFTDNPAGGTLTALKPAERQVGLQSGKIRRCPGSATQSAPDGSNPYTPAGSDCDPSIVPPGP
ncbi:MAG: phospholipid/cholesterol/gamma-HCH transport system substrate-binding protein [Baekduia sp.]|jgi:phospholipid/cholesterol/gamma-HCH transport system substrate-binding protein|nr:phospholipid/cholesterol/gamma-HCH transport system substrate-binding protein [Baekduia sp.]MDX6703640.1 phospholipid/cholesterol/gamma-HCH transport system substrate-binding protein [Baekduia sp.]